MMEKQQASASNGFGYYAAKISELLAETITLLNLEDMSFSLIPLEYMITDNPEAFLGEGVSLSGSNSVYFFLYEKGNNDNYVYNDSKYNSDNRINECTNKISKEIEDKENNECIIDTCIKNKGINDKYNKENTKEKIMIMISQIRMSGQMEKSLLEIGLILLKQGLMETACSKLS